MTGPSFREALRYWLLLGSTGIGGPAAQIPRMRDDLVTRRQWVTATDFDGALAFCTLLPGPEAQQLATFIGWRLHGIRGGLTAGILFVLPGSLLLGLLSAAYLLGRETAAVSSFLAGLQPAVVAFVAVGLIRMLSRADRKSRWLAALWLLPLTFFDGPWTFPLVLAAAGLFGAGGSPARTSSEDQPIPEATVPAPSPWAVTLLTWMAVWWLPLLLLLAFFGKTSLPWQMGVFFSKAAMLTFGGAYAVLPLVGNHAVESAGWIGQQELLDALALGETTPGLLVLVLQFIGTQAGWNHPGELSRPAAALLGGVTALWSTFVPSFLWIFTLGPRFGTLLTDPRLNGALRGLQGAVLAMLMLFAVRLAAGVCAPTGTILLMPTWIVVGATALHLHGRIPSWLILLACGAVGTAVR